MKKNLLMVMLAASMVACSATKPAEPAKTPAQQLIDRLDTLFDKELHGGFQDSSLEGLLVRCGNFYSLHICLIFCKDSKKFNKTIRILKVF